jgi:sec-independent protein translocase protein TatA
MLADIIGPDVLVVIAVIALLFGGSQLPKLARSLGTAKSEFQKGMQSADTDHAPEAPSTKQTPTDKPSA